MEMCLKLMQNYRGLNPQIAEPLLNIKYYIAKLRTHPKKLENYAEPHIKHENLQQKQH